MTILDRPETLPVAQAGMRLVNESYLEMIEEKAVQFDQGWTTPDAPKPCREFKIVPNITEAQWETLDGEGWELVMGDFKGINVHVVLARTKPAPTRPVEPEAKAEVETPATPPKRADLIIPPGVIGRALSPEPTVKESPTVEPVAQPAEPPAPFVEPVGAPVHIQVIDPAPILATMTRAEQFKAESNARIFEAGQGALAWYDALKPAPDAAPFGVVTLEVSRV